MSIGNILFWLIGIWNLYCLWENPYSIVSWLFAGLTIFLFYQAYGFRAIDWVKRNY